MERNEIVVVTGATGRQGGPVARRLLEAGFPVRAFVRDPGAPAAQALAAAGAELVRGSFDDPDALRAALRGAFGLFAMQNFWQAGYVDEVLHARNQLDAARAEGVEHVVYSSAGIEPGLGVPHAETKMIIEALTREAFPNAAIVRGVWFIEGLGPDFFDLDRGTVGFVTAPDQEHCWVSVDDIGRFAVRAFREPAAYAGVRFNLASAVSTGIELAAAFGDALGRPLRYEQWDTTRLESWVARIMPGPPFDLELRRTFEFIREVNFTIDWQTVDALVPERHTLDTWIHDVWLPSRQQPPSFQATGCTSRAVATQASSS